MLSLYKLSHKLSRKLSVLLTILPLWGAGGGLVMSGFSSCGKVEDEYTTHQCYFSFNVSTHNTSLILAAVSSETYAFITRTPIDPPTVKNPRYKLTTTLYGGQKGEDIIKDARETQQSCILGLSNGLIVGKSSLNNLIYAYDQQCPNCFSATNRTIYPVTWADNPHTVKCDNCHRFYDLSNGGVVSAGENGSKLLRYRCMYDEQYLRVQNR